MHDGVAWDVTGSLEKGTGDWDHICWIHALVLLHYMACICNRMCFHLQLHHIVFHHLILRWQHAVVAMTLLPVQDQVRNQGRNKIDDSMQSLLRPCCLSYFSSLFVCCCCDMAALSCFAMQPFCDQAFLRFPPLPSSVLCFLPLLL